MKQRDSKEVEVNRQWNERMMEMKKKLNEDEKAEDERGIEGLL